MRIDQADHEIGFLISKIEGNRLDLQPNFQRGEIWSEPKKRRLIDSILRRWYVPPIHIVVNDDLDREEILDGQQRLRAIHEFYQDRFSVDGNAEPLDDEIQRLDGLFYSQLPSSVKSRFNRFLISSI